MTSVVDKYYNRIIRNTDNVTMQFDISALLVKSKEHDSKIDTNKNNITENLTLINSKFESNKNNISENLTLINTKYDIIESNKNNIAENLTLINSKFETNKNNISENLTLIEDNKNNISENLALINTKSDIIEDNKNNISENLNLINSKSDIIEDDKNNISENLPLINSNENRLDDIENDIEDINTKVTNNYNITQINKKSIDFKTGIIDNQITAINSTLNDLKTKNNSKCSIENFFIYNIEVENTYTLNSDNLQFSIFNYDLVDDFKKDSILEINARLLYDYNSYNNIGKLIHNYKLYDSENVLFHEFKSSKSNAGDNLKNDLSQIGLFYVKLNKDHDRIKIELILSMIEGVSGTVSCKLYNTFNSNFLCIKYIKKN